MGGLFAKTPTKIDDINKHIYESYSSFRTSAMEMEKVTEYGFMQGRYRALEG